MDAMAALPMVAAEGTGTLRSDVTLPDFLRATFPGGSVTGAPKIRAMEIIEDLEPIRRGPYCGAIGCLAEDGSMQFNVAIRTMIVRRGQIHIPVGGGIVADSDPQAEYEETLVKARAMFAAVGVQGTDKVTTVRAYVFTATGASGQHTEEQGRLDAVKDMRDALGKKKGITLVDSRADANLLIEVVSREDRAEPGAAGPFGGKTVTRMGDTNIRLHVKSGDEESDLKGIGQGTWGRAAKDAADRILKWIARREPPR